MASIAAMAATETRAAIKPYSMVVAPESSFRKVRMAVIVTVFSELVY